MKVAFLGLGIMGRAMAANLVKAGHDVTAWNRTPGKEVEGARAAATAAAAAAGAEVVWLCVSDTAAVEQVLFGPEGVERSLAAGMVVADSSTISPHASRSLAERVRQHGADFVDVPVTGSKAGAEAGQLVFIAGGREVSLRRLEPLLSAMGKKTVHVGENGLGESAKLAMNLMIAMIYEGFAEALTLSGRLGVPAEKLLELIDSSMLKNGVVDYKAPFVLRRDFSPNFPLRLMAKDLRLALEAAEAAGVRLPGIEQVKREIYDRAQAEGHNDLDYAATLLLLEK